MTTTKKTVARLSKPKPAAIHDPVVELGLRFLELIDQDDLLREHDEKHCRTLTHQQRARIKAVRGELDQKALTIRNLILLTEPTTSDGRALCLAAAFANVNDVTYCAITGNDVERVVRNATGARAGMRPALCAAIDKLRDRRLVYAMYKLAGSADFLTSPKHLLEAAKSGAAVNT